MKTFELYEITASFKANENNGKPLHTICAQVEATSAEEAMDLFKTSYLSSADYESYEITLKKCSLPSLIQEEEEAFRHRIFTKRLFSEHKERTVDDYIQLLEKGTPFEESLAYYQGLKMYLKQLRITEYLESRLDTSKMTHKEFCDIRDALCLANSSDAFKEIHTMACSAFGKNENIE